MLAMLWAGLLCGCVSQQHVLQNTRSVDIGWSPGAPSPAQPGGSVGAPNPSAAQRDVSLPGDDPNIIGVRKFLSQDPWLSFNREGVREADGFKATVYLESGTSGKGAFGDGILRVVMYSVQRDRRGAEETLTREYRWDLTPMQSTPWRAKRPTRLGNGYGLRLSWGSADVHGKEIELVFQFIRRDGSIVTAEPQRLRVPDRSVRVVNRIEPDAQAANGVDLRGAAAGAGTGAGAKYPPAGN